ncbi:hypothetical protein T265_03920 [Opisthorchis viverrini]|uniref:Uncharacterized protein n=1 Tax=Opisthorchis viverrini TaxID=6198 RepID=A0A075AH84_OPIVI|nr:hypothetical protein T265_03920 [Opisthorchis viverrini]KER29454.1 hypothetical protein T265_03920 [Opisthorchis viverrini]
MNNHSAVAPFRCLASMPHEGGTRAEILPGRPNLDRGSRVAEVGFEPRTFRSATECAAPGRLMFQSGFALFGAHQVGAVPGFPSTLCSTLQIYMYRDISNIAWATWQYPIPHASFGWHDSSAPKGLFLYPKLILRHKPANESKCEEITRQNKANQANLTSKFQMFKTMGPFRCLTAMAPEGSMRARILPGCPSQDRGSREAEVGFEQRTFRSITSRYIICHVVPSARSPYLLNIAVEQKQAHRWELTYPFAISRNTYSQLSRKISKLFFKSRGSVRLTALNVHTLKQVG